jgi:hypothetical protein
LGALPFLDKKLERASQMRSGDLDVAVSQKDRHPPHTHSLRVGFKELVLAFSQGVNLDPGTPARRQGVLGNLNQVFGRGLESVGIIQRESGLFFYKIPERVPLAGYPRAQPNGDLETQHIVETKTDCLMQPM